jgi:large subunit ribosomal protein L25
VGVKTAGGVLDQVLREVDIECLPADIPSHIDVDVSHLALWESLRVSDLPHTGSIKFLNAEDATVAHVISIREEVAPVAATEAAAIGTAEGAATTAEPEVAKKGKPEAEAAGTKKPEAKK